MQLVPFHMVKAIMHTIRLMLVFTSQLAIKQGAWETIIPIKIIEVAIVPSTRSFFLCYWSAGR